MSLEVANARLAQEIQDRRDLCDIENRLYAGVDAAQEQTRATFLGRDVSIDYGAESGGVDVGHLREIEFERIRLLCAERGLEGEQVVQYDRSRHNDLGEVRGVARLQGDYQL